MPETSFSASVDDTVVGGRVPVAQSCTRFTDMWRRTLCARALLCSTAARTRRRLVKVAQMRVASRQEWDHRLMGSFYCAGCRASDEGPPGKSNDPGGVLWGCSHHSASQPPTSATSSSNKPVSISCSLRGITLSFVKRNLTTRG